MDQVQDVMEFIARHKNWLKIARTQKMKEYKAKMGLVVDARLDDEEDEELLKTSSDEADVVAVPEAFEHETFLGERKYYQESFVRVHNLVLVARVL